MAAQRTPPDVAKFASLSLVWGAVAIAGYIFLPWVSKPNQTDYDTGISFAQKFAQNGLALLNGNSTTSLGDPLALTFFVLILLIPVAAVVAFATGIIARVNLPAPLINGSQVTAAIIGLAGTLAMFVPYVVENPENQLKFFESVGVVGFTAILARGRKPIQNLFQRNPALASLIALAAGVITVKLADLSSFTTIVVAQAGLWLALISFGIILYSSTHMARAARKARKK